MHAFEVSDLILVAHQPHLQTQARRMLYRGVEHAFDTSIDGVLRLASGFVVDVYSLDRLTDPAECGRVAQSNSLRIGNGQIER
ncbi:hypothetical protein D3C81_1455250 [compost metagenome]